MKPAQPAATRLTRAVGALTGWLGSFPAILASVGLVAAWFAGLLWVPGGVGNNTYQLLINTGTTIVTFLMVFIIQNSQNRDGKAIQTKLDAIMAELDMDPRLVGLEDAPERKIAAQQQQVRAEARPPRPTPPPRRKGSGKRGR